MSKVAFTCHADDEDIGSHVVLAEDEKGAAAEFEAVTNGYEPDLIKRAPEFDKYADAGDVPPSALLAAGWWMTCTNCEHHVGEEGCEQCSDEATEPDADECAPMPDPVVDDKTGNVFCSQQCADAWRDYHIARREAEVALKLKATSLFVGCEIVSVNVGVLGAKKTEAQVELRVPGCQGTVRWMEETGESYAQARDVDAWVEYLMSNKLLAKGVDP